MEDVYSGFYELINAKMCSTERFMRQSTQYFCTVLPVVALLRGSLTMAEVLADIYRSTTMILFRTWVIWADSLFKNK